MASFAFDFDLVVALLKFILPTKNEEDERAVEFLASRFHETWRTSSPTPRVWMIT